MQARLPYLRRSLEVFDLTPKFKGPEWFSPFAFRPPRCVLLPFGRAGGQQAADARESGRPQFSFTVIRHAGALEQALKLGRQRHALHVRRIIGCVRSIAPWLGL